MPSSPLSLAIQTCLRTVDGSPLRGIGSPKVKEAQPAKFPADSLDIYTRIARGHMEDTSTRFSVMPVKSFFFTTGYGILKATKR